MKHYTSCLIILLLAGMFTASGQDTIRWSPHYKLKWSDFTAAPDTIPGVFAMTSSGIKYKYSLTDTLLTFSVVAFFDRNRSWKIAYATSDMLSHEQLHFDITEFFARKLKLELARLKPDRVTGRKAVMDLVQRVMDEYNQVQLQYDDETDQGKNLAMQKLWQDKIDALLQQENLSFIIDH